MGSPKSPKDVIAMAKEAGAQIVVVGNAIERDPMLIKELAQATKVESVSQD